MKSKKQNYYEGCSVRHIIQIDKECKGHPMTWEMIAVAILRDAIFSPVLLKKTLKKQGEIYSVESATGVYRMEAVRRQIELSAEELHFFSYSTIAELHSFFKMDDGTYRDSGTRYYGIKSNTATMMSEAEYQKEINNARDLYRRISIQYDIMKQFALLPQQQKSEEPATIPA